MVTEPILLRRVSHARHDSAVSEPFRSFGSAAGFGAFSSEGKDLEAPVMPDG